MTTFRGQNKEVNLYFFTFDTSRLNEAQALKNWQAIFLIFFQYQGKARTMRKLF